MRCSRLVLLAWAIVHSLIAYALLCGVLSSCAWKFEFWARHEILFRPLYPIGAGLYAFLCVRFLLSWKFLLQERVSRQKVQGFSEPARCLRRMAFEFLSFVTHCFVIICFILFAMPITGKTHCLVYSLLISHFLIHCYMTYIIAVYLYKTNNRRAVF